jgi:hypothetical protein
LLDYSLFSNKKAASDGYKSHCKCCEKLDRIKNFERDKRLKRNWIILNKERDSLNKKEYNDINKVKIVLWKREYRKNYERNKLKSDIQHTLRNRIRTRLYASKVKTNSTKKFIDCSIPELKTHLELLFQPGMTWDNWSRHGWHIDHIKPLSSFDLRDPKQLKIACHYTNLQPLWAKDNLRKGNKV